MLQNEFQRLALGEGVPIPGIGADRSTDVRIRGGSRSGRGTTLRPPVGDAGRLGLCCRVIADPDPDGLMVGTQPAGQLQRVLVPQLRLLDAGHDRNRRCRSSNPTLGRVQVVAVQGRLDGELEQRAATGDQLPHRAVTPGLPQLTRIHSVRRHRHEGVGGEPLIGVEGLECRLLPGGVAIEGVDHLTTDDLVVGEIAAQHTDVLVAECRPAGRHRGRLAGQMHGHHVGVALDDDDLTLPGDFFLGEIQAVEQLGLLVQRRFRGVDVLGLEPVVLVETARAEAHHIAGRVVDRPQQPAVEPVHRSTIAVTHESGALEFVNGKALRCQGFEQLIPTGWRISTTEPGGGLVVETPIGQERAGRSRRFRGQLRGIERRRSLVRRDQPRPTPAFHPGRSATLDQGQSDPDPVGQPLDGFDEVELLVFGHEGEDVAAFATAEAVVRSATGTDLERGGLLVVKRAEPLEVVAAGPLECDIFADDLVDPVGVAHPLSVRIRDPSRHGWSVCPREARRSPVCTPANAYARSRRCRATACASVSRETWSNTTRNRAASSRACE